jgi:hypothetical protein
VVLIAALAAALAVPVPAVAARTAVPSQAEGDVDRPVRDPRIGESSGLAVSPQHRGVLWTHDDSGNPPLLFALAHDGQVAGTLRLRGVADFDWEAVAAFRDATGRALLAVGDLGDNRGTRRAPEVDVVTEPARLGTAEAAPVLRLRLSYPDGPHDAEALLVDTVRGRMFVVTKGLFGGEVYVVPASAWNGTAPRHATERPAPLVRVGSVPLGLVTDGTVAPGGEVLLRTYTGLAAFAPFPVEPGDADLAPLASAGLPLQRQGEGLALAPDARSVLLSSEGADEPVLRVDLAAPMRAALSASAPSPATAPPSPSPRSSPGPSASAAPVPPSAATEPAGAAGGDGSLPWGALALAAVVVAGIAVAAGRSRR